MYNKRFIKYSIFLIVFLIVIATIVYFLFITPNNTNSAFAKDFEEKLRWQIERQWYWAMVCQVFDVLVTALAWISGLVLLALSGYQFKNRSESKSKIYLWIAISSALTVSSPALLNTFDLAKQQTIYEGAAREYDELYNQFVYAKSLTEIEAVKIYNEIHKRVQYSLINKDGLSQMDSFNADN